MKKIYEMPLIKLKSFENVNTLTLSGGTAGTHAADVAAGLLNKKAADESIKMEDMFIF